MFENGVMDAKIKLASGLRKDGLESQMGTDACHHLSMMERLRYVIDAAYIQPLDFVKGFVFGCNEL